MREWRSLAAADVVRWLDRHGMDPRLGGKIVGYYGSEAVAKLSADPYRLLAFDPRWKRVDRLARTVFGVGEDDPRRLHAAAAEALYRELDRQNTAADAATLLAAVERLLGSGHLARRALNETYADGGFVESGGMYQARGVYLMERFIAAFVADRAAGRAQLDLLRQEAAVGQVIGAFEREEHGLGDEQRRAVRLALASRFAVITGGAGVGKTSVLKAVHRCAEAAKGRVLQMALSGRAAKRLSEATGRPAMTIAGFLQNTTSCDLAGYSHLVVDEASMLDVLHAFRIFRRVPASMDVVLVGDAFQLPPIGPGLVFHLICEEDLPVARLTKVYRQTGETGIPEVSKRVRDGEWPGLPPYGGRAPGVCFVPTGAGEMAEAVLRIYDDLGGPDPQSDVQVLCATRAERPWGTAGINTLLHGRYAAGGAELVALDDAGGVAPTGIAVGDPVLFTRNDWDRQVFNGSLGRVLEVAPPAAVLDRGSPVCRVEFDGKQLPLTSEDMEFVELAYAITVHKAQGSQFRRVIVPVWPSRLLDRTLVYTAITRSVEQVVLVGDEAAARRATEQVPLVLRRAVGLHHLLGAAQRPQPTPLGG